jgi:putative Ca2+/H+ antiporter (TMEM165/GDT1 family)
MDFKLLITVFGTVFLAELGDKTQLATVLFAAREGASLTVVFLAASLALITATGMAVLAGSFVAEYANPKYLSYFAGAGFILIGAWTIWQA